MKAIDIMMNEHRVIESVLNSLGKAVDKLDAGEEVRPDFFLDAVHFIYKYADECHHGKEENIFFDAMLTQGYSKEEEPLSSMYTEHKMGRHFARGIKMATEDVKAGDGSRAKTISANARNYITLLKLHILREETEIFPKAKQELPLDIIEKIEEAFSDKFEKENEINLHSDYKAVAEKLKIEMQ